MHWQASRGSAFLTNLVLYDCVAYRAAMASIGDEPPGKKQRHQSAHIARIRGSGVSAEHHFSLTELCQRGVTTERVLGRDVKALKSASRCTIFSFINGQVARLPGCGGCVFLRGFCSPAEAVSVSL